jgi:hypothetical protein
MKIISKIVFTTLVCINVSCGQKPSSAKSNATIKVTDTEGKPLSQISVGGTYFDKIVDTQGFGSYDNKSSTATTNESGIAKLSNRTRDRVVYFGIDKADGYYEDYGIRFDYTSQSFGVWQPDNPMIEFKLKPIKNPIALYAKRLNLKIPLADTWLGLDFEKGDLIQPHGKGIRADILFKLNYRFATYHDLESTFQIKFPHEKDGAKLLEIEPKQLGSILKMPYLAPEDGYLATLDKNLFVDPKNPIYQTNVSDRNFYFLRLRSETDASGKLLRANYAKIHNDFIYGVDGHKMFLMLTYYYNPNPNDRNLEFDMKRNLFKNLTDSEAPLVP